MISKSRTCTVSKPRQTRGGVRPPHNRNFDSTHVDHHAPTVSPPQGGRAGDRGSRGGGAPRGSAPLATGLRRALLPFFRRSPSPRSRDREILLAQRNRNRSLAVGSCRDRAATEANHRHVGSIVGDAGGRRRRSAAVNATSVVVSSFRSGSVAASATLSLFFFPLPPSPSPRFAARKAAAVARALLLHHYAPSLWCPLGTRVAERNAHTGLRDAELLRVFYARVFEEKRGDGWGGRAFAAKERIARGRDEKRGEGWNDRGRGGRREKRREREERELRSLRFLEGK